MSEARTIATYTLPTPEVSPLEPAQRPLDYQTYGSLAPHPDRFSFDGGSLTGEFYFFSLVGKSVGEPDDICIALVTFERTRTLDCDWFPVAGDDRLASPLAMS